MLAPSYQTEAFEYASESLLKLLILADDPGLMVFKGHPPLGWELGTQRWAELIGTVGTRVDRFLSILNKPQPIS